MITLGARVVVSVRDEEESATLRRVGKDKRGTVILIDSEDSEIPYRVMFDDGYIGWYCADEVSLYVIPTAFEEKIKALIDEYGIETIKEYLKDFQ